MRVDTLIKNAKLVIENHVVDASIGVLGEKIACICKDPGLVEADNVFDAKGLLAMPGAIDPHAHMWDPKLFRHEDYESGSRAALLGGITSVIDMPLTVDVDTPEKARERIREALRNSLVDIGLHAGFMRKRNLSSVKPLCMEGVCSFKVFTCPPYEVEEEALPRLFVEATSVDGMLVFHAEDGGIVRYFVSELSERSDPLAPHEARPAEAEAAAIARLGFYARLFGAKLHIAHHSSLLGLQAVREARKFGADISVETCPQYLVFTRDDAARQGTYLKMAPSLKQRADVEALWKALASGEIEMVATDHAPSPREEKDVGVWKAWGGIPGLATMVPLLYTHGVKQGKLSLGRFIDIVSRNAARRFGLDGKGCIAPGFDADIVVLDVKREREVRGSELYKVGWSPYDGMKLTGWPKAVFSRGELVVEEGLVYAKPGRARFLRVKPLPSNVGYSEKPQRV